MFVFKENDSGFTITLYSFPIIQHSKKNPFCIIGTAEGKYSSTHGMFTIKERKKKKYPLTTYTVLEQSATKLLMDFTTEDENFTLLAEFILNNEYLEIQLKTVHPDINRCWFRLPANKKEAIYGCGEQFSELNLRGSKVPIWTQEQGIGRGDPLWFTVLANLFKDAGGDRFTTYFAQPTFLSSQNYFCHIETTNYCLFDFNHDDYHSLYIWDVPEKIILGKYSSALDTVTGLTKLLGRQPTLPDWIMKGLVLGVQGGKEIVNEKIKTCHQYDILLNSIWCQDWVGERYTSFGKQLFWDWIFDETLYPKLPDFIKELHKMNIKFLGYINPFLALEGRLYHEASEKNYLVTKHDSDEEYHVTITTFPAAILDLTNPEAVLWIKKIIKENLIKIGLDGWMADFGEYLPADAHLFSNENAEEYHNQYPVDWAKLNYETLEETGNLDKRVFFTRAGYSHSSKYSPLFWAGDQLVSWSKHDGLASIIPAGLSLGISGIGYYHFDIGGYTAIGPFKRCKEVFMRWAETAAFTMVMRTHEGNRPNENWQFDSDKETLQHLAKMVKIHTQLYPYLKKLKQEYSQYGYPPMRALYLHYEDDEVAQNLKYQFLLGRDLLIAPVIEEDTSTKKVYLPNDIWVHLWTNKEYTGKQWVEVDAPIGEPPVFYRKDSSRKKLFKSIN
ncbi:MAG: alpha-glucosidase [Asgard group archaeon]|nr:alpha-glucosidase [Asgard group archaeon]